MDCSCVESVWSGSNDGWKSSEFTRDFIEFVVAVTRLGSVYRG